MNWKTVFKSDNDVHVNIVVGHLEKVAIPFEVLNKKDSSYIFLGMVEVLVPKEYFEKAEHELSMLKL
ncbi:MAG: DUF2007 domain-containing protein [Alphaproteobacteria bacterium]|nr:DUF2007 domain-containing protein [Alphaproteobacteria bacterium]